MKFIFVCAFITVAAASRNHNFAVLKAETPTTEYREQDSKGFYSFGYSGDESAKAEYKTLDGSSKGFYSYIDSNGKLQTVQYEAGRRQGFTATASNLPTQPEDDSPAPEPVTDTPEVEMAKQAHFEAYREAALKAAMEPEQEEMDSEQKAEESSETNKSEEQMTELQHNTRELLMNKISRDQLLDLLREQEQARDREEQQPHLMTTYILTAQAEARTHGSGHAHAHAQARIEQPNRSELRTLYRLENADSNVELKMGNGNGNGNSNENSNENASESTNENSNGNDSENMNDISNLRPLNLWQDEPTEQISAENSYYTVDNPSTHYTVEIPTVLTTLPRIESIRLGGNARLPLAKSTTYITQRLKSSTL